MKHLYHGHCKRRTSIASIEGSSGGLVGVVKAVDTWCGGHSFGPLADLTRSLSSGCVINNLVGNVGGIKSSSSKLLEDEGHRLVLQSRKLLMLE